MEIEDKKKSFIWMNKGNMATGFRMWAMGKPILFEGVYNWIRNFIDKSI